MEEKINKLTVGELCAFLTDLGKQVTEEFRKSEDRIICDALSNENIRLYQVVHDIRITAIRIIHERAEQSNQS